MIKSSQLKLLQFLLRQTFLTTLIIFNAIVPVAAVGQTYIKLRESVPLTNQQEQHVLKGNHDLLKAHKAILIGKHKIAKDCQNQRIVQLMWIGVASEQHDVALFDHPFVSSLKTDKAELSQGLNIPFTGNVKQLEEAVKELEKKGSGSAVKKMSQAQNQQSTSRRVDQQDVQDSKCNNHNQNRIRSIDPNGNHSSGSDSNVSNQDGIENTNASSLTQRSSGSADLNLTNRTSSQTGSNGSKRYNSNLEGGDSGLNPGYGSGLMGDQSQLGIKNKSKKNASSSLSSHPHSGGSGYYHPLQPGFASTQRGSNKRDKSKKDDSSPSVSFPQTVYEPCDPRIDEVQKKVIIQTKAITKHEGHPDKIGACQDTLESYIIQKDYTAPECTDLVKGDQRQAFTRYKKYWVDNMGQRFELSDRLYVEEGRSHPFIEEHGNCRARVDLRAMLAYPQLETVYYGRGNKRIVVETCHDDTKATPSPIYLTPKGCEVNHDYTNNTSREEKRAVFTLDNILHEARPCFEQDEIIVHQFDTSKPCKSVKDFNSKQYIKMGRRFIELSNGKLHYLSNVCEPTGGMQKLQFTTEGCQGYEHNYALNKSYPKGRWYVNKTNSLKKFITSCAPGPLSFDHINQIIIYHHIDSQKLSYPVQQISVSNRGLEQVVKAHKIRFDQPAIPYQFVEEVIKENPNKQTRYEGCYKFTPLAKLKVNKRIDNSFYYEFVSEQGERKSKDLCVRETEHKTEYEYIIDKGVWISSAPYKVSFRGKGCKGYYSMQTITLNFEQSLIISKDINNFSFTTHDVGADACIYIQDKIFKRTKVVFPGGTIDYSQWDFSHNTNIRPYMIFKRGQLNVNPRQIDMPGAKFDQGPDEVSFWDGVPGREYKNNLPNRVN